MLEVGGLSTGVLNGERPCPMFAVKYPARLPDATKGQMGANPCCNGDQPGSIPGSGAHYYESGMLEQKNTKIQGTIGLGSAIQYFTSKGFIVSIPINDSQSYDLLVDSVAGIQRVQVKTCRYKRQNSWEIGLRTKGGNQSCSTVKKFDKTSVDLIFVLVENGDRWLIPVESLKGSSSLKVGCESYKEFLI